MTPPPVPTWRSIQSPMFEQCPRSATRHARTCATDPIFGAIGRGVAWMVSSLGLTTAELAEGGLVQTAPDAVLSTFDRPSVLLTTSTDISLAGERAVQWLIVTAERVVVLSDAAQAIIEVKVD